MKEKARKAGVYLASANWTQLTALVLGALAAAKYLEPWLATVILPAVAHHVLAAWDTARRALGKAAYLEWLKMRGFSQDQAQQWYEQELADRTERDNP